jgi:SulP family sulfate permease
MAGVGLESLLTLNIIDEITETGNKEAIAQVAQIFYRVFLVWVAALCWDKALLMFLMVQEQDFQNCCSHCFVMFGAGLIEVLPMAALTGLMIMVAIGTFEWASLKTNKMPKSDILSCCRDTCNFIT